MSYEDDLNKPLGKNSEHTAPAGSGSSKGLIVTLGAVCIAAIAVAATLFLTRPEPVPETVAEAEIAKPLPPDLLRTENTEDEPPETQRPIDPDAEPLEEIEPIGTITEPKVVPTRPNRTAIRERKKQILAFQPDPELSEKGASGVIPKISSDGLRPMDVYAREPLTEGNFGVARVVLIIGGMGISQSSTQQALKNLPGDVVLAFAPYGNSLTRWMQQARKNGHEILLQIPMEPFGYPQNNPGQHTLKTEATVEENIVNLHWAMSRITNYVGVMNYLGGKLLSDPPSLSPIMTELASRGLLFVDDGTAKNSNAEVVANQSLLPFAKGTISIDGVRTRAEIGKQLNLLAQEAKRTGIAVGVGNAFPETISMVTEFIRQARKQGIEITPVSAIATKGR